MVEENRFPKIKEVLEKIKNNCGDFMSDNVLRKDKDYVSWVIEIVNKLENNNYFDEDLYNKLLKKYPQVKNLLDDLIKQVEIYSVYDLDKSTINFDFKAYLEKMESLIE